MINFFSGIIDFLNSIVQFIINTLASIIWVITSIPKFTASLTAIFAYCPTSLLIWLELSLALTVLFAVIKLLK